MKLRSVLANRAVRKVAAALGILVLGFSAVAGTFVWYFIPFFPDADYPPPTSERQAFEQDLEYLATYAKYEKAFEDPEKRSRFEKYLSAAHDQLPDITQAGFELLVAGAVALADNGHTNVSPISRTRRVNHLPVRTGPFQDGHFVVQATSEHADLVGAEILAIEGHAIVDVAEAFVPFFGGVERRARFFSHLFITSPDLLHAVGLAQSPDRALVSFRLAGGDQIERYLAAVTLPDNKRHPFGRELMDYRVPDGEEEAWVALMQGKPPPRYLADPDQPYRYELLEEEGGAYIKINFNYDVDGRSLVGWLEDVAADLMVRQPRFAVVDLRFNGGGTDATASFAKRLPELIVDGGPIYVLTSHETFSAAIGAAAEFKEFAGRRAVITGALVGDRLRYVANGGTLLVLPNSKISIPVWSSWEDYANGCWEWSQCFWLSPFFRNPGIGDLDPDIPVAMNFSDYVNGKDAFLEAALSDFAKR